MAFAVCNMRDDMDVNVGAMIGKFIDDEIDGTVDGVEDSFRLQRDTYVMVK